MKKRFRQLVGTTMLSGIMLGLGCQSNVGAGVNVAQARATCLKFDDNPDSFDAVILEAEASRNAGLTETQFIVALQPACYNPGVNQGNCNLCVTQIAAAVWR